MLGVGIPDEGRHHIQPHVQADTLHWHALLMCVSRAHTWLFCYSMSISRSLTALLHLQSQLDAPALLHDCVELLELRGN